VDTHRQGDARRQQRALGHANARRRAPATGVVRRLTTVAVVLAGGALAATPGARGALAHGDGGTRVAVVDRRAAERLAVLPTAALVDDTLAGRSGKLRARFVAPSRSVLFPFLRRLLGDTAVERPGVYEVRTASTDGPFRFITMRAFGDKVRGRIGSYRIGFWPGERGRARDGRYANPEGSSRSRPRTSTPQSPSTSASPTS
jgi:hypothetical protein